MSVVQAVDVSLAFGEHVLFEGIHLSIQRNTRAALTGANGSGKTTLMKILAGLISPDSGEVVRSKDVRISYLPQTGIAHAGNTLYQEMEQAFQHFHQIQDRIDRLCQRMASVKESDPEAMPLLEELHQLQERLDHSGFYHREARISEVLRGLGFSPKDVNRPTEEFSGGWQMRIALAKVLLEDPDVLLLDEPTNYLDIEARSWLENFLSSFSGGVLLVSHDKYFLDVTVTEVYEIFNRKVSRYVGNYSSYEKKREEELRTLLAAYRNQQEEIARQEEFIRRFRYNASKAALVQSRIKQLEKLQRIEVPETLKKIHFQFPPPPPCGKKVLEIETLSKSYGTLNVFSNLSLILEKGEKLVVVGPNGAGKSSLLRILARRDKASSGRVLYGSGIRIGYFSQEQNEELDMSKSVLEEIEKECPTVLFPKIRDMLGAFLFRGNDVYKSISVLSGGERNRLALLKLLLKPANLFILDEPTNHLDLTSKDVLLEALQNFPGTVIFVSHDRYFMDGLATKVLEMRLGDIPRLFVGNYSYYLQKVSDPLTLEPSTSPESTVRLSRSFSSSPLDVSSWEQTKQRKSEIRKVEKKLEEILTRIEVLEGEYHDLEAQLAIPEVYRNGEEVRRIKLELEKNQLERDRLHREWETTEELLQSLLSTLKPVGEGKGLGPG
ncbi:MAG: ABC-F family ATP-binding cassette domain-containing protein [Spirochaetes bacterium]|nr:ABC-F family ATP-binding cassette domain-containing protein [Spirochaetota bacterium]